ncbi:MAG: hypothetical protein H0X37_00750 [Herpetosiphonaceae bacterium]|nr:hypothetical protein [Herpetosiphonaceae bacterium]
MIVMVAVALVGCSGVPTVGGAAAQEVQSSHTRQTTPAISEHDRAQLVADNTAFAWHLYDHLRVRDGNMFFSPYSISQALAMTYVGAQGVTAQQIAKALHFNLSPDHLHPAFNALDQGLMANAALPVGKDEGVPFVLKNANAIWGQHGYPWKPAFLDLLAEQYGAGLRVVDFQAAPEPARTTINDWVKGATAGKIVDLLPASAVTNMTRMVLTNAIYFKADWLNHFQKELTRPADWTSASNCRCRRYRSKHTGCMLRAVATKPSNCGIMAALPWTLCYRTEAAALIQCLRRPRPVRS